MPECALGELLSPTACSTEAASRGQDGFGVLQPLDFIFASGLAHVEILDDEVALGVQLG